MSEPTQEKPAYAPGWNPGPLNRILLYGLSLRESYEASYRAYKTLVGDGPVPRYDRGLARDILPVGIYSSCWVTCNPRSLMAFLSLRTHDAEARHVSYPLWEIEIAARAAEKILAEGWPMTYEAFVANGRVAP